MKILMICVAFCFSVSFAHAGECLNGKCNLANRTVVVARELITVPAQVTKKTVETTRNVGRRTVNRVRNIVR
jgi:hypothetical protein